MLDAASRTDAEKSSPIMSQGTGPKPTEKEKMKTQRLARGRNVIWEAVDGAFVRSKK